MFVVSVNTFLINLENITNPYAFLTSAIDRLPTKLAPASYVKNDHMSIAPAVTVLGGIIFPVHFGLRADPNFQTIDVVADNAETCDNTTLYENTVFDIALLLKLVNVIVAPVMPVGNGIKIVVEFTVAKSIVNVIAPLPVIEGVYVGSSNVDFQVPSPAKYVVESLVPVAEIDATGKEVQFVNVPLDGVPNAPPDTT